MVATCYKASWYWPTKNNSERAAWISRDNFTSREVLVRIEVTNALLNKWPGLDHWEIRYQMSIAQKTGAFSYTKEEYHTVQWRQGTGFYTDRLTVPENCYKCKAFVRPREKTDGEKWKYLAPWSVTYDNLNRNTDHILIDAYYTPPNVSTPSITVDKYKVTLKSDTTDINGDMYTTHVQFWINDENGKKVSQPTVAYNQNSGSAIYVFNGTAGKKYSAFARAYNSSRGLYSEWSDASKEVQMPPVGVAISSISGTSPTSVRLTWPAAATAKTYEVNYTSKQTDFEIESGGSSISFTGTSGTIDGLETGKTWYFRIRSVNDSGESGWSAVKTVLLGIRPSPPTTWSSVVTGKIGENITLNWTHNTRDGSSLQESQLYYEVGTTTQTITIPGKKDPDTQEWENTGKYILDTTQFTDGSTVRWRVRTRGVLEDYSDWSITREIKLYAPATLSVVPYKTQTPTDNPLEFIDSFPFYIIATAGPDTQKAISFHISIVANDAYQKTGYDGETVWVNANEEVYSQFFDFDANSDVVTFGDYCVIQNNVLTLELMPYDVDFENGIEYTIKATVAMNSGLSEVAYNIITVNWEDQELYPNGVVEIDDTFLTASILPFCPQIPDTAAGVVDYEDEHGEDVPLPLIEGVSLGVYRLNYDGSTTKILDGVANDRSTSVVDPHPTLDFARYRIVAIDDKTGAVGYTDLEPVKVGQPGIVLQWDESYSETVGADQTIDESLQGKVEWSGSMLTLPFNVKTSEGNNKDVEKVEYIGAENPTSYFGTQKGVTASWSTEIDKKDIERIAAIRRLDAYMGNVYVRNSRGVGYWAVVDVSYNIDYDALVVPISLSITRVKGGI